ncbi:hypothetical protein CL176_10870 [Suicoccus acidiformans]|uniref:CBS domain-containing protein n=1 Tax=Suicoccus acidiformans TaxID=2036206 RepID=A0A347WMZ6_9LACT|nr:CBS domain-containing protein [Suicoccus acidiformans]AXY26453.1 hypothetical protein CL176_10870 [Suicoccus acidiformans]
MFVKDFMTQQLITITSDTSVSQAEDIMNQRDINRLPVVDGNKLVGLVTRDTVAKAKPSDATSLDAHELNYLLDKTMVGDIMLQKVITVQPDTMLQDAAALMSEENIGVLLVLDGPHLAGIITDKDIFKAFVNISGYGAEGQYLIVELSEDRPGVIEEIGDALVSAEENLTHMMVYHYEGSIRIVLKVNHNNMDALVRAIEERGYTVVSVNGDLK